MRIMQHILQKYKYIYFHSDMIYFNLFEKVALNTFFMWLFSDHKIEIFSVKKAHFQKVIFFSNSMQRT